MPYVLQNASLEKMRSTGSEDSGSISNFIDSLKLSGATSGSSSLSSSNMMFPASGGGVEPPGAVAARNFQRKQMQLQQMYSSHNHNMNNHKNPANHNHLHNNASSGGGGKAGGEDAPGNNISGTGLSFAAITESLSASSEDISDALGKTFGLYKTTASTTLASSHEMLGDHADDETDEYDSVEDSIIFTRASASTEEEDNNDNNDLMNVWNALATRAGQFRKKATSAATAGTATATRPVIIGSNGGAAEETRGTINNNMGVGVTQQQQQQHSQQQRQLGVPLNFKRTPSERTQDILSRINTRSEDSGTDGTLTGAFIGGEQSLVMPFSEDDDSPTNNLHNTWEDDDDEETAHGSGTLLDAEEEDDGDDEACSQDGGEYDEESLDGTILDGINILDREDSFSVESQGLRTLEYDDLLDEDEDEMIDEDDDDEFNVYEEGLLSLSALIYKVGTCTSLQEKEPHESEYNCDNANDRLHQAVDGMFPVAAVNAMAEKLSRGRSDTPRTPPPNTTAGPPHGLSQSFSAHYPNYNNNNNADDEEDDDDDEATFMININNPSTDSEPTISGDTTYTEYQQRSNAKNNSKAGLWQTMFGCGRT